MTSIELPYVHAFVDRHGKSRYYFRYRGRRWPLPAPGDPGFAAKYEALKKSATSAATSPGTIIFMTGSIGWAIEKFTGSADFSLRAETTKKQDRRLFDEVRRRYGTGMMRDLSAKHVKIARDYFRETFCSSTADVVVGLISTLWNYADEHLDLDLVANPTVGVRRVHKSTKEHQPWPDAVIDRFAEMASPKLRLALVLALYTGQRRSDLVKMKWDQVSGEGIAVRQQKTKEPLVIPCHRALREALTAAPRHGDFILPGRSKKPLTPEGLSAAFRRMLRDLQFKGLSIHGLRKNAGAALADAGCSDREIMAITGHRTTAMVTLYTRSANQRRRARSAIDKWEQAESGKPKNIKALGA